MELKCKCSQVATSQVDMGKKKDGYVPSGAVGCREGRVDVGIGTDLDMRRRPDQRHKFSSWRLWRIHQREVLFIH
jgi:hypothetical protein